MGKYKQLSSVCCEGCNTFHCRLMICVSLKRRVFSFKAIFWSIAILSIASLTDPLKDPGENGPLLKQILGSVLWQKGALCPCSSAPKVTLRIQRWMLGGAASDSSFHRVYHSWWETVNYLDSSFRVGAVSLGQNLWPGDGTHTHTHTEWRLYSILTGSAECFITAHWFLIYLRRGQPGQKKKKKKKKQKEEDFQSKNTDQQRQKQSLGDWRCFSSAAARHLNHETKYVMFNDIRMC